MLILVPSAQAHIDVVAFDAIELNHNDANFLEVQQNTHHQNDSNNEKNTEHHHHCSSIVFSSPVIITKLTYDFLTVLDQKRSIFSNKNLYGQSYLNKLFQPPKV